MFFNIKQLANAALTGYAGGTIKHAFKIDVDEYSWVKDYMKDKEFRDKIGLLRQEILETGRLLIDRDELRQMFIKRMESINDFKIMQLSEHLKQVQSHEAIMVNEMLLDGRKFLGASLHLNVAGFPDDVIDKIFSALPSGVKKVEKENITNRCEKEIKELMAKIEPEHYPSSRWIYKDDGKPYPYPQGCRWTAFVQVWEAVAVRFNGPVNIEGYEMWNSFENEAYLTLGLGERIKLHPTQPARKYNSGGN